MKRVISSLLAIVIIVSLALVLPVPASAESLYIRKIVSVVYDDSGSMQSGSKWAYANYAMQAFCGMLNSEDQLFITYMSEAKKDPNHNPPKVDLTPGGIQNSIDQIRGHKKTDSTPYEAVEIAFNKLKSVSDPNPNTQYWLVVITDGEFDSGGGKTALNNKFNQYTSTPMPNGTKPQVTFLSIGNVATPTQNISKGIYTYSASDAKGIIGAMSDMADRISGRTRLQSSAIRQIDDRTVMVSSTIPLLNIAVFAQGSQAKVSTAEYATGGGIPISRKANLSYPGYKDLVGGAFLIGNSQTVIKAGSYLITFDQAVNLNDIIILFEPALELRMSIKLNGKELQNPSDLNDSMEGDTVSISCKIYEMGTDREVDPSLMPPGTKFEITVSENGTVAETASGTTMELSSYTLKNLDTQITGAVLIDGFNPIDFSVKFTPAKYVPKINYTIEPSYGSDVKSVKFDDIAKNQDLTLCFTVYADGVAMTDPQAVKALNPVFSVSPQGNSGTVSYSPDGKIIFTPNAASVSSSHDGSFNVTVTCTIDDGTTASEDYTVLVAAYEVVVIGPDSPVKKTELFGNQTSVSFYITKDGVKLPKEAVEKQISILLNEEYAHLKHDMVVSPDGTITVTPYSEEEYKMYWLVNWWNYWALPEADLTVTLSHAFGVGKGTIDIVDEDGSYIFWCVIVPFVLFAVLTIALIAYIIRTLTKPRFAKNGVLYVGRIKLNKATGDSHFIKISAYRLKNKNKNLKQLLNPFAEFSTSIGGVAIQAAKGNKILCKVSGPWYSTPVIPVDPAIKINTPQDIIKNAGKLGVEINEVKRDSIMSDHNRVLKQNNTVYYFAKAKPEDVKAMVGKKTIQEATVFCYAAAAK